MRTIRFWSDEGVLPETDRSAGGYRRYDARPSRGWTLLGALNGWDAFPSRVPAYEWVIAGLRAHP